ncbi:MAG: hypothetical protein Q8R28_10730 [Dehalococcoidia bacterium]|nr:hypothetical protein [Dehalococcoidia bacterium]
MRFSRVEWWVVMGALVAFTGMMLAVMHAAWWGWQHGGEAWASCVVPASFNVLGEGRIELFVAFPLGALWGIGAVWIASKR